MNKYELAEKAKNAEVRAENLEKELAKVQGELLNLKAEPMVPSSKLDLVRREKAALKRELTKQVAENEEMQQKMFFHSSLKASKLNAPGWLAPKRPKSGNRAIVTTILSDSHFDEIVNPEEVQGLNAYNREIAQLRLKRYFDKLISISRDYLSGVTYDGCVLMLGGDMFAGELREEDLQTNEDTILASVLHWTEQLAAGIDMIADEFGKVNVPVVVGNHPRRTRKPRMKLRVKDNFDWLLGCMLDKEFKNDDRVTFQIPESADCRFSAYNCVAPDTKILTSKLEWVSASSLQEGDGILGFDEELQPGKGRGRTRRWKYGNVSSTFIENRECVKITLLNGREIISTLDHKWLCSTSAGNFNQWIESKDLKPGHICLRRFFDTWETDSSKEAGWLAGIIDGEGCLSSQGGKNTDSSPNGRSVIQPSISQNPGVVADQIRLLLKDRGIDFRESIDSRKGTLRFSFRGGFPAYVKALGEIRPYRMLEELHNHINLKAPHMNAISNDEIIRVENIGLHPVVVMGTTTKTYIADGYGAHNTRYLLTHGDQFRGGSGAAGIWSPLKAGTARKMSREAITSEPFDFLICGHFHTLVWGENFIVNGANKGYDEFAYLNTFSYEEPRQAMWLTTPDYGAVMKNELYVADREAEGW